MIKLAIGTLNGGGTYTLERLHRSFNEYMSLQLAVNCSFWKWHILVQGDKGASVTATDKILSSHGTNVNIIKVDKNIGVVQGTNEIFDYMHKDELDAFMILDDDIELTANGFLQGMILALLNGQKTCSTHVCCFTNQRNDFAKRKGEIIEVADHGSGFTMYHKDVFDKCGYYDEKIVQYGSDTEYNNRIKRAFGNNSLSLIGGVYARHHNQTGTKNCYSDKEWDRILAIDSGYIRNHSAKSPVYLARKPAIKQA